MAEQDDSERELQDDRDAAVGEAAGGADASGTGNILASVQRQDEDDRSSDEAENLSGKGEEEGGASTNREDDHLTDDQRPTY